MGDILKEICEYKLLDIDVLERATPLAEIRAVAESVNSAVRPFGAALRGCESLALIAEIKRASPSRGLIRSDFDVGALARAYALGGAVCLSVLTDARYFRGDYDYLDLASCVSLPILQKDFMLTEWQIYHARTIGADCILLIMGALSGSQASELESLAHSLGLHVLLEVHDGAELDRALRLKSDLVGVNNRNLKTLEIDFSIGDSLLSEVSAAGRFAISESGLYEHSDLLRMERSGARAFLIGESLMGRGDVAEATRVILGHQV